MSLNVAIIGPGRSRQGTGPFVAKTFFDLGCCIKGIVSSSLPSAKRAARILKSDFEIDTECFSSVDDLIESTPVDVIAICSPIKSHRRYLDRAIKAGAHIFCEKPLWWPMGIRQKENEVEAIMSDTRRLVGRCKTQNLYLHLNTQWPFTLPTYYRILSMQKLPAESIESFSMWLSPAGTGRSMIVDSVPHLLSMIYALVGSGRVKNIEAQSEPNASESEIDIKFDYLHAKGKTKASLCLRSTKEVPKPAAFAINKLRVDRHVDLKDYNMSLRSSDIRLPLVDPLASSIKHFLSCIRSGVSVDEEALVDGMVHLTQIYQAVNSN